MIKNVYLLLVIINRRIVTAIGHVVEHGVGYSNQLENFNSS